MITTKKINLGQLDQELGGFGLSSSPLENGELLVIAVEHSPVTEAQLEAAIDKHVAVDEEAIRKATKDALLARLGITEDEAKLLLS